MRKAPLIIPALPVLLVLAHLAVNAWWLAADNHVYWLDEQVHLEQARALHKELFLSPEKPLAARVAAAWGLPPGNPAHPPLLYFTGALLMGMFGYGPDVMTFANSLFFAALLAAVYLLARQLLPDRGLALAAMALAGLTPGLYVSSRYFMTDVPAASMAAWAAAALARSRGFRDWRWSLAFGVFTGLALCSRTVVVVYLFAPACVAALWWRGEGGGAEPSAPRLILRKALCLALAGLVCLAVAAPWHLRHRDAFLGYWLGYRASFEPPFALLPGGVAPKPKAAVKPAPVREDGGRPSAAKPAPAAGRGVVSRIIHPSIPWQRYPVMLCNNGVFLLTWCLGLAGLAAALRRARRSLPHALLAAWVIGSWVLLTVLFRFATPRYLLPVLAPWALLAAWFLLSRRRAAARWLALPYGLALLLCHAGLTFAAPPGVLRVPVRADGAMLDHYGETGLCAFQPRLSFGFAYSWMGAPVPAVENYQERIQGRMREAEKGRARVPGEYARYGVVNLRGMGFTDAHYWRDLPGQPNPYRDRTIPVESLPQSRLILAAHRAAPEELEGFLGDLDYVVCAVESAQAALEPAWRAWFDGRGCLLMDEFAEPCRATIAAQKFLLYATPKGLAAAGTAAITVEAVAELPAARLFAAMGEANAFADGRAAQTAQDRLGRLLLAAGTGQPLPGTGLSMVLPEIIGNPDSPEALIIFNVAQDPGQDLTFIIRGDYSAISPESRPEQARDAGYVEWQVGPVPPTGTWRAGEYQLIRQALPPGPAPKLLIAAAGKSGVTGFVPVPLP